MRTNFKFKIAAVLGLLAILIGLTGCANNNSNKITVVGSSAMQLLAEQAGNDYRLSHPDSNIVVQGGGVLVLVLAKYRLVLLKSELLMFLLKHKKELMQNNCKII